MSTTLTFPIKTKHSRILQDLVKQYDGRFLCNLHGRPDLCKTTWVEVEFEDLNNCNAFGRMHRIMTQPYF